MLMQVTLSTIKFPVNTQRIVTSRVSVIMERLQNKDMVNDIVRVDTSHAAQCKAEQQNLKRPSDMWSL